MENIHFDLTEEEFSKGRKILLWTFTGLFPFIFSLTRGGPGYETTTLDYMIYLKSFVSGYNLGEACAVAVLLLLMILALTVAEMKATGRVDDWSE